MEKQYLDYEGFEHTIERLRRKEMPTASVDYVGQIVQYVGGTDESYTKGYYYECVSDGETPATYSWVPRPVQDQAARTRYNVLDYGLIANNQTPDVNNSVALSAMMDELPEGAVIYFPQGTWRFATPITITKSLAFVGDNDFDHVNTSSFYTQPQSELIFDGTGTNETFIEVDDANVSFEGLSLYASSGSTDAYRVSDNPDSFQNFPYPLLVENINRAGINGISVKDALSVKRLAVRNCTFRGFSGYALQITDFTFVRFCNFSSCAVGVQVSGSDDWIQNCSFVACGVCVQSVDNLRWRFCNLAISDTWADQIIKHVFTSKMSYDLESSPKVIPAHKLHFNNLWIDEVNLAAIYLPGHYITNSSISGRFSRVGMSYAEDKSQSRIPVRDDTSQDGLDAIVAYAMSNNEFDIQIDKRSIGKGGNSNGVCPAYGISSLSSSNRNNKVRVYDAPKDAAVYFNNNFINLSIEGNDEDVIKSGYKQEYKYSPIMYLKRSPIGYAAPFRENLLCYDLTTNTLYRSTGTTNTDWEVILSKASFVTPEQFGAVGDGITDDTQAIDTALTTAINKKIPIKFAHKTYLVNSFRFPNNIIMLGDNATLLGGSSLANIENNNRHDIYVKGITFDFSKRIKLQGNASTQYANIIFEDCVFKGAEQTALHFQWVSDIVLRNCKFDNCGAGLTDPNTYGRAVNIVGQTNDSDTVFMKNIVIDGCEFSGTYGNKAISIDNGWISGIDIRNCYFHDTTYGGIEFYNWHTKTNGYSNVVHDCVFERIGAAPMATGDPNSGTSSSGVGCCALYLKNSSSAVIATRNIFKYCVENAIEGSWQEISYNIIDTTGVMQDTRPTPSIEGIYLNGTQQSVHHNEIKRTGRTAIIATNQNAPGITDLKIFSNIIKDSNQYEGWTGTDDIRCTMFAKGLTLRDNSYDNNFFLNLDSSNGSMENFYWNQPRLFISSQALHFKNGIVDIDGETSRKDGWELSSAITQNDEGHYLLPQNAQMAYKFEFNRFDGARAHLIAKVKYSMQDIIGTGNVLRISIDADTSHPSSSVLNIKGKYASAASEANPTPDEIVYNAIANPTGNPSEQGWYENTGTSQTPVYTPTSDTTVVSGKTYYQKKEYYTDYAILNTDNTSSKILTAQIKNVSANAGNLEIVDIDFKVPYGIAYVKDNAPRYNVLDYGLKGDKTTDNTSALRNLISVVPNGSVIFFPVGTYMISEGIEINKDVTFLGENQEMQSAGTASNRLHDPMSIIKYGGNTANVTMFTKASGYYDVNFVNLTLDGGNSYDVTDNWTGTFTTLPFYNQVGKENLEGINGLDMSMLSPGIVKNCMFWGFSGYGVKVAQHKYVERCGFLKCRKGIVTVFSDSLLHDLWFCKSGTAIYMLPKENDYFASISLSDIWADQLIDHLVEADSSVTSAQIITDNVWVDSVGKSAFYLPEATISKAYIQGTFGRIGMDYAGIADTNRTNALAKYTDFMACGRLTYSTLDLNISNVTIGKGSNANGECFSRLVTTYKPGNANDHNKIICNWFPVSKLYDPNTQPQYASFSSSEYKGTDGDIVFYGDAIKFVNGFCTYNLSPVGRIKAIGKDFIVYDRVAKKLYRSTAADDNTAWEEITMGVTHYDIMPSTEELRALPNNTYFYTKGYYTPTDGHGGFYSKNNLYIPGSYEIPKINDSDPRVFITCLDNPVGHINLCKYGLREAPSKVMEFSKFTDVFDGTITTLPEPSASLVNHVYEYVGESVDPSPKKNYFYRCVGTESQGETTYSWKEYQFYTTPENTYATTNSAVLGNIYYGKMGTVFTIDEGKYFFESPLDLTPRTYGLKGASVPNAFVQNQIQRNDYSSGTILYFPFLTNGQTAIKTFKSSISDLTIYGNPNTYNLDITRGTVNQSGEMIEEPNVTENIAVVDDNEVRCTGLNPKGGIVENVYIANFYKGIDVPTSNTYLHNIFTWRCRNGVTVGNDVKCMGIYGWYNYILLTCTGAISSAVQVRGDSLVHLLNIQAGGGITISDADGDWCAKELVILGKESGAYSQISGIRLNDLHGRSCGLNYYDSNVLPNGRDVRDLSDIDGYGMIRILPNTVVKDSHISIDYVGGSLIDGSSRYKCTNIAFTQNTTGALQGIYFVIPSLQTKEDILRIIQTKTGFISRIDSAYSTFFIEDGNVVEVTTGTDGMYKVYSGNYDSVKGEFYDADGNALPKVDKQQYYDITTRTTWIYYSAWSGFFRLFNDVVGMESSQMNGALMTKYYPELNAAHFRCMNVSGNDGGLIEGFIYKLDRMSVTPKAGDSPANEGWWEVDSTTGKMIQTTDTEVVSSKLYFKYVWTQVKPQQSVFPGTLDEWEALTPAEQAKYDFVATPDEAKGSDLPCVDISSQITMANDTDGNPIFNSGSGSQWDIFSCVKYGRMVIFSVCFGTFTGKITSGYACFTGLPKAIIPAETGGSFDTRWFINQNDTRIKAYFSRPSSELENTATRFQLVYFTED